MKKLNEKLSAAFPWYDKWHKNPSHAVFHWLSFLGIAILFTTSIITTSLTYGYSADENIPVIAQQAKRFKEPAQDHILVKFKRGVSENAKAKTLAKHSLKEKSEIKQIGVKIITIPSGDTPEEVIDRLNAQDKDSIEFAEVDAALTGDFIPNDSLYSQQWQLPKMSAEAAWDSTSGSSNVIIAILDTGVDCTHEDLAAHCVPGWNVLDNNSDAHDIEAHGTAVAGSAVSIGNNGVGISSPCPNCSIMPIRIADANRYAYWSNAATGLTWAADHGARIANLSYGTPTGMWNSGTMISAAQYFASKNGLFVAAAGNSSAYSADPDSPYFLIVSGADQNDVLYSWSNYGPYVDVAAAGCVTTTNNGGGYGGWCGTSFAAPTVAGVAGLILSKNPSLTPAQLTNLIKQTADDIYTPGFDIYSGAGRPNMSKAILAAGSGPTPDTIPPSVPANLSASAPLSTQVSLSWSPSLDNVSVAGYNVFRNNIKIGAVSSASFTDTSAQASASYTYNVSAYDAAGNTSGLSNAANVTTPVASVSIVTSQIIVKSGNSATVTWTTNIPSTGSVVYGIASGSLDSSVTDSVTGTTHSLTLTGLTPNTRYYYQVKAASSPAASTANSKVSNFRTGRK